VLGVLAQRLVRTLCPHCKVPDEGRTRETLNELAKPWRMSGGVRPYKPVGCLECRNTGFPRPRRPVRAADDERATAR
jgi:general secretion pathway protein E